LDLPDYVETVRADIQEKVLVTESHFTMNLLDESQKFPTGFDAIG